MLQTGRKEQCVQYSVFDEITDRGLISVKESNCFFLGFLFQQEIKTDSKLKKTYAVAFDTMTEINNLP